MPVRRWRIQKKDFRKQKAAYGRANDIRAEEWHEMGILRNNEPNSKATDSRSSALSSSEASHRLLYLELVEDCAIQVWVARLVFE